MVEGTSGIDLWLPHACAYMHLYALVNASTHTNYGSVRVLAVQTQEPDFEFLEPMCKSQA